MALQFTALAKGSVSCATLPLAVEAGVILFNLLQVVCLAVVLQRLVVAAPVAADFMGTHAI